MYKVGTQQREDYVYAKKLADLSLTNDISKLDIDDMSIIIKSFEKAKYINKNLTGDINLSPLLINFLIKELSYKQIRNNLNETNDVLVTDNYSLLLISTIDNINTDHLQLPIHELAEIVMSKDVLEYKHNDLVNISVGQVINSLPRDIKERLLPDHKAYLTQVFLNTNVGKEKFTNNLNNMKSEINKILAANESELPEVNGLNDNIVLDFNVDYQSNTNNNSTETIVADYVDYEPELVRGDDGILYYYDIHSGTLQNINTDKKLVMSDKVQNMLKQDEVSRQDVYDAIQSGKLNNNSNNSQMNNINSNNVLTEEYDDEDDDDDNVIEIVKIVGYVFAGIAVLILIIFIIRLINRKRLMRKKSNKSKGLYTSPKDLTIRKLM